jgi:hypothetical protein
MSLWILSSINKGGFPLKASSKYYYNGTKKTSLPLSAVSLIFLTSSIFIFEDDASLFLGVSDFSLPARSVSAEAGCPTFPS